jgi:DNA-binding CsgD family transcriptional regulator
MSLDSQHYLLLRRIGRRGVDSLTARERDVIRRACGGASNKEIAYEMGVRAPTVRVLLRRACQKVGAAGRDELIQMLMNRPL